MIKLRTRDQKFVRTRASKEDNSSHGLRGWYKPKSALLKPQLQVAFDPEHLHQVPDEKMTHPSAGRRQTG